MHRSSLRTTDWEAPEDKEAFQYNVEEIIGHVEEETKLVVQVI